MSQYTQKNKISKNINNSLKAINLTAAGIDIGANEIFVCAGKLDGSTEVKKFSTFTTDLKAMINWFKQCNTTSVAMESTGVYWIPAYDMLEQAGFEVILVNAYHLKTVPGRKTDVKDCQWIQQLHSYGLLQGSFRPEGIYLTLRGYTRHRSKLTNQISLQVNLMHKALSQMNIQLRQTITDIDGVTGMKIIRSIIAGERDPFVLAQHRSPQCKSSIDEIAKSLEGNFRPELVFALQQAVEAYDFFQSQIIDCENHIKKIFENDMQDDQNNQLQECKNEGFESILKLPQKKDRNKSAYNFDAASELEKILGIDLTKIPGLAANLATKIISEIGTNMDKFPKVKNFTSWLALCPGNKISGGKVLSSRTKSTANKASQAFRLAAYALSRSQSALGAFFRRMRGRLGTPKAITATAHKLAKIVYYMLRNRTNFHDIGQEEFEKRHKERTFINLKKRASALGFDLIEKKTVTA